MKSSVSSATTHSSLPGHQVLAHAFVPERNLYRLVGPAGPVLRLPVLLDRLPPLDHLFVVVPDLLGRPVLLWELVVAVDGEGLVDR